MIQDWRDLVARVILLFALTAAPAEVVGVALLFLLFA
jgi:hypothetical protein